MTLNGKYHYAEIDLANNKCVGVQTTSKEMKPDNNPTWVEIPVYDPEYLFKYYINDTWYEDTNGTILWQSRLL